MRIEGARGWVAALGVLSAVSCGVNHDCTRTATCAPPDRDVADASSLSGDAGPSSGSVTDGSGALTSSSLSDVTEPSEPHSDSEDPQGIDLPLPPFQERDGGPGNTVTRDGGGPTGSFGADSDASTSAIPDSVGPYEVGGSVEGLTGELVLLVGDEDVVLTSDGPFAVGGFADAGSYEVTVISQPIGQRCDIANGSGTIDGADVDDVVVDCLGDVATLAELSISPKQLSPDFAADTLAYEVELSLVSQVLQVRAEPSDSAAFVVINQSTVDSGAVHRLPLQPGENIVSITVTAPSGRTESYTVTATRTEMLPEPRVFALPAGVTSDEPMVTVFGETMVVHFEDNDPLRPQALLYERVNGQWVHVANLDELLPDNTSRVEQVTICDRWLVLTAALSDDLDAERAGYVFSNATGDWVFDSVLPSEWDFPNTEDPTVQLACDGDTILTYPGSTGFTIDTFERVGTTWTRGNIATGGYFALKEGLAAFGSITDSTAAVGVNGDEVATCPEPTNCLENSGAVRLFEREGQGWMKTAYLKPQNPQPSGLYGRHVVLFGQYLAVGFLGDGCAFRGITNTPPSATCSGGGGSVYVYERDGGWSNATYIKPEVINGNAIFGFGIWGYGDLMFVAAPMQEPHSEVYGFLHDGATWRQMPQSLAVLEPPNGDDYLLSAALGEFGFYTADYDASVGGIMYRYED